MDQQKAREIKSQLADYARELAERSGAVIEARDVPDAAEAVRAPTLAIGLAPHDDGGYAIAVRYRLGVPTARSIARKVASEAGDTVDVRRTGRIRPLAAAPAAGRAGTTARACARPSSPRTRPARRAASDRCGPGSPSRTWTSPRGRSGRSCASRRRRSTAPTRRRSTRCPTGTCSSARRPRGWGRRRAARPGRRRARARRPRGHPRRAGPAGGRGHADRGRRGGPARRPGGRPRVPGRAHHDDGGRAGR